MQDDYVEQLREKDMEINELKEENETLQSRAASCPSPALHS